MNMSAPVVAVTANAIHVHLKTSDATAVNGRAVDATPRSRRSTIAIVPNTKVKPITCTDSMNGNRYSELRIAVARPDASIDAIQPGTLITGPIQVVERSTGSRRKIGVGLPSRSSVTR